jgi:hypothetical protein
MKKETIICPNCGHVEEYKSQSPTPMSEEEIREWLIKNVPDASAYWIDHLLKFQSHPLSRVDKGEKEDEKPRAETWLKERENWQGEVKMLQEYIAKAVDHWMPLPSPPKQDK